MNAWILLWKVLFITAVTAFAGMSVWVAVGGWQDIRKLLERLKELDDKGSGD